MAKKKNPEIQESKGEKNLRGGITSEVITKEELERAKAAAERAAAGESANPDAIVGQQAEIAEQFIRNRRLEHILKGSRAGLSVEYNVAGPCAVDELIAFEEKQQEDIASKLPLEKRFEAYQDDENTKWLGGLLSLKIAAMEKKRDNDKRENPFTRLEDIEEVKKLYSLLFLSGIESDLPEQRPDVKGSKLTFMTDLINKVKNDLGINSEQIVFKSAAGSPADLVGVDGVVFVYLEGQEKPIEVTLNIKTSRDYYGQKGGFQKEGKKLNADAYIYYAKHILYDSEQKENDYEHLLGMAAGNIESAIREREQEMDLHIEKATDSESITAAKQQQVAYAQNLKQELSKFRYQPTMVFKEKMRASSDDLNKSKSGLLAFLRNRRAEKEQKPKEKN